MMQMTQQLISDLKKQSDSKRIEFDRAYHKSSRKHLGVTSGLLDEAIKPLVKTLDAATLRQLADELWQTHIFDGMIAGTKILKSKKVPRDQALWRLGRRWLNDCDGWALMDNLSASMREVLVEQPKYLDEVESWTKSKNFWMRRAALVFTLPYAKPGRDPERMLKWASSYANDPEWFIQKAIGWWLRDLGSHNPKRVIDFLREHWDKLRSVAKHEATRKLDQQWTKNLYQNR